MKEKFSFLKDPRAIAEIHKHKWIESQKAGREIGFATCAVDWIEKYGQAWKEIHVKEDKDYSIFIERRRFRRFELDCKVKLKKDNLLFLANIVNINLFGLSCTTNDRLHRGNTIGIQFLFGNDCQKSLVCDGIVERVMSVDPSKYELFLRFDDYSQKKIEDCGYFNS